MFEIFEIYDSHGTAFIGDLYECAEFLEIGVPRMREIRDEIVCNKIDYHNFKGDNYGLRVRLYTGEYDENWRDFVWRPKNAKFHVVKTSTGWIIY